MVNKHNIPKDIPPKAKAELEKLLNGNVNFVNCTPNAANKCVNALKELAFHQEPYAVVLTCSDSRVVPEIIFDCGIGELFVIRVAGAAAEPSVIESVEYAVKTLEVPLVIILGHDDCGVMKYASRQYPTEPGYYTSIMDCLSLALEEPDYDLYADDIAKKQTTYVQKRLIEKSDIIRKAVEEKKIYIANCHLDHTSGCVCLID